ncbi:ly6/PLAUR domain-containing protein 6 isoform X2 [Amblyraja radiata]|uniref:ly6/PLAUR domain-containing protein 6 isoform X2 n=1 Tax=Amblyraja radiata TaxID=386614 RepID=UPI0014024E83|nr:ly6/PLAUR domain-containing protein 6 isoform X2 [Amblyraja radiata]
MEARPGLAWVLLLSFIADCLKLIQPRDFTVKDIIYLHPSKTQYCYTRHKMNAKGDSSSVTKRCVSLKDCLSLGCTQPDHEGYKICTSCCEGTICNLPLPRNTSQAVFATLSPINQTTRQSLHSAVTLTCISLLLLLVE